jgi:hypothetical protein
MDAVQTTAETQESVADEMMSEISMDSPHRFINREFSWLKFNQRVLEEAFNAHKYFMTNPSLSGRGSALNGKTQKKKKHRKFRKKNRCQRLALFSDGNATQSSPETKRRFAHAAE